MCGAAAPCARHVDHLGDAERLSAAAPPRAGAQHRDLARGPARGGTLWGSPGRRVLRRINVQPRARCFDSGARSPRGGVAAQQHSRDRLPAALTPPGEPRLPDHSEAAITDTAAGTYLAETSSSLPPLE